MLIDQLYQPKSNYLYEGLDHEHLGTMMLWESVGHQLNEKALTADEIAKIFQQVDKDFSATGANRTMMGRGMDAASAVGQAWENLKTKIQTSGPVQGVDRLYDTAAEKLKQATGGDQGVMKYVQKYRDFAKKHPVAQSFIYSALIAAAGISGAGLGGAAALGLFKLVDKLLQGEKFSSAAYAGAKTGALAYGASKLGDLIKGQQPTTTAPATTGSAPASPTGMNTDYDNYLTANPTGTLSPREFAANQQFSGTVSGISGDQIVNNPVYQKAYADALRNFGENPSARAIQTAKQIAAAKAKEAIAKGATNESVKLTEAQLNELWTTIEEGLGWDQFKSGAAKLGSGLAGMAQGAWTGTKDIAGKAAGAAGQKLSAMGRGITTKVTADKLNSAWKQAGSPTDSLDVAKVIQSAGVPSDIVKQVYGSMNIPFPGTAGYQDSGQRKIDIDQGPAGAAKPTTATTPAPASTQSTATGADEPQQAQAGAGGFRTGNLFLTDPEDQNQPYVKNKMAAQFGKKVGAPAQTQAPATAAQPQTTATQQPLSIGGQKIDPNDPLAAKVQQQLAQQGEPAAASTKGSTRDAKGRFIAKTTAQAPAATTTQATSQPAQAATAPTAQPGTPEYFAQRRAAAASAAQSAMAAKPASTTAAAAPAATPATSSQPVGFSAANVMNMPGMAAKKTPTTAAATPNFARGPSGYGATSMNIKSPAAPKAPKAPTVVKQPAVAETVRQVKKMLESVRTAEDVAFIQRFIQSEFERKGLVNEQAKAKCRQLITEATRIGAIRRREHLRQLAN